MRTKNVTRVVSRPPSDQMAHHARRIVLSVRALSAMGMRTMWPSGIPHWATIKAVLLTAFVVVLFSYRNMEKKNDVS